MTEINILSRFLHSCLGVVLSAALVVAAPGTSAYAALGRTAGSPRAAVAGARAPGAVPGALAPLVVPALSVSALTRFPTALDLGVSARSLSAPSDEAAPLAAQAALSRLRMMESDAVAEELSRDGVSAERARTLGRVLFESGLAAPAPTPAPAAVHAPSRRRMQAAFYSVLLAAGLMGFPADALGRGALEVRAPPAREATTTRIVPEKRLPAPVKVTSITVDRQGAAVGERLRLSVTVRNASDQAITISALRGPLQDAFPADVEIQGRAEEGSLALAAGESRTVVYDVIAFSSGKLSFRGGVAYAPVAETQRYPRGIELALPDSEFEVRSVLTPDWRQKGLRDIVGVMSAKGPYWAWLAAIPAALLLSIGAARLIAARRRYPRLKAERLALVVQTEARIAELRAAAASMDTAAFYAETQELLSSFLSDHAGLPKRARDAESLRRDLRASRAYDEGVTSAAYALAARAQKARFNGEATSAQERLLDAGRLLAVVEAAAGGREGAQKSAAALPALGVFAAAQGAAGLHFADPWALLLFVPLAAYGVWSYLRRSPDPSFTVSSSDLAPSARSWRERLGGLPKGLRWLALILVITALARPQIGVERRETFIPSTDTVISVDVSGSMETRMSNGKTRLQGAGDAVRAYVDEQRRGTQNRVGLVAFDDDPYLAVRLTTDYDALIAAFKDLSTKGSTAVGKSILTSIGHFAELNIRELAAEQDDSVKELQRVLERDGLGAALERAKAFPGLMERILQPERAKIVVLFTDGESNSGIAPGDAARIAAQLKVKVYTVGIGEPGAEGFDALREVAALTGAKYFTAGDGEAMRQVLLEISRLERSPARVYASVAVKDYTSELAGLAFLLLLGGVGLGSTSLRRLHGVAFALLLPGLSGVPALPAPAPVPVSASAPALPLMKVPADLAEANGLYAQGRYADAVRRYAEAAERHPDMPEIYFNMGDAYMRLGEPVRAEAAYRKYVSAGQDPRRLSQAFFNLGNAALASRDAERAVELYKEALRRDPGNEDARWNLEILRQQQLRGGRQGREGQKPGEGQGQGEGRPGGRSAGDKGGSGESQAKPDSGDGAKQLGGQLKKQESEQREKALRALTRKGQGVWAAAPLGLLGFVDQGVTFASGGLLWAAVAGTALAATWLAWAVIKSLRDARRLSPAAAPKSFKIWWGRRGFVVRTGALLAAVLLVGLTMADPRGGIRDERVDFGGKDVEVVVDVSHSAVYAEDGRHERTRRELREFIARLQGADRVGLVVFAGQARAASPLSVDYSNFEFKVSRLESELRGLREGSDLAGAVRFAAERFDLAKKIGERGRVMIVISDGDVSAGEISRAVEAARRHKVAVYTVGVGSLEGARILVPTIDGKNVEPLIDSRTGRPALTRLVEGPLRVLAESTGGAYFRAGESSPIDRVLKEVAAREQGRRGDVIKSPSPVGTYLLWPALALLLVELLLKPASFLRRPPRAPRKEKKEPPSSGAGSTGMMGAALIPLGAWPQIFPSALLGAVVAALLVAELWTGGGVTRAVRETWQRRTGLIAKGVARDLALLFELRAADENSLGAFLDEWRSADAARRAALIGAAADDEALWREKLVAAYLSGASPETGEAVLAALERAGRRHLEPLAPVVERAATYRGKLAWTVHGDAAGRFERLAALAAGRFAPAPAAPPVPGALSWRARAGRAAALAVLAVMLAAAAVSGAGTWRFAQEQAAAREQAARIVFADDLFVFSDRYDADARIPELVLPALRRWHSAAPADQAAMERALAVLRSSPEPKADNILLLLFKRADLIALSEKAKTTLLTALMERESGALWALVERSIVESGEKPAAAALLKKMILIGAELGTEQSFINLFHVLKSPDAAVRDLAFESLFASLTAPERAERFYDRLDAVQRTFAADPVLQLWTAHFAMRQLKTLPPGSPLLEPARELFDKILAAGASLDKARAPGSSAFLPELLAVVENMGKTPQDAAGPVARSAAGMARYVVNKTATMLIEDGEALFPGLHRRLLAANLVAPDVPDDLLIYDEGYSGGGLSKGYRAFYTLAQLRRLAGILDETARFAAAGPDALKPAVVEYLTRAQESLERLPGIGSLAGLREGGEPAESVAAALFPTLKEGTAALGESFLLSLRAEGLAPAVGDPTRADAYPETLDVAGVDRIRGLLLQRVRLGQARDDAGRARSLTWPEKVYLAKALSAVDAARARLSGVATPAEDTFAFFDAPGESSIALARLKTAVEARARDGGYLLRAETALLERVAAGKETDSEELSQVLPVLFAALAETGQEVEAWRRLAAALAADPDSAALKRLVLFQASATARAVGKQAVNLFGDAFAAKLYDQGVMTEATMFRDVFNQRHLQVLRDAIAEQRALERDPAQNAARRLIPRLNAAYMIFVGPTFLDALRAQGFALNNKEVSVDKAYPARYDRAEVGRLLAWAQAYRQAGVTLKSSGAVAKRALNAAEKTVVNQLIAELEDVLGSYPQGTQALTRAQREAMASPAERVLFARASALDTARAAADRAGAPRGDAPGEIAVDQISGWLHKAFWKFPGTFFLNDLRAAGFALDNDQAKREFAYPPSYSRAEVERLLRWLEDFERRGVARTSDTETRPFDADEKRLLKDVIAGVRRVLESYPLQVPVPAKLHGFAPGLPLLAAAPVVPVTWLLVLGLLAAAAFAVWAFWAWRGADAAEEERGDGAARAAARHKRLELAARRLAESAQWGAFRSRAKGDGGLEYAQSRDYEPGDSLRDVDWLEYAQSGELSTKVFDQERELPLILAVDVSKSGGFGTHGVSKSAVIEEAAAVLALAAARSGQRVGAVFFSDRVEAVIAPGGGKAHGWRVAQAALQAEPRGGGTDLNSALAAAAALAKTRAVVIVLSDFIAASNYKESLSAAAARHDVRLIRVVDPAETRPLPDVGLLPVEDAESGAARLLDTSSPAARRESAASLARREALITDAFSAVRARPIVLSTEGDPLDELIRHFRPKAAAEAGQSQHQEPMP